MRDIWRLLCPFRVWHKLFVTLAIKFLTSIDVKFNNLFYKILLFLFHNSHEDLIIDIITDKYIEFCLKDYFAIKFLVLLPTWANMTMPLGNGDKVDFLLVFTYSCVCHIPCVIPIKFSFSIKHAMLYIWNLMDN